MLKRIFENIKWVLNHPPVDLNNMTDKEVENNPCSYCGSRISLTNYVGCSPVDFCICRSCLKKTFDKVLKPKNLKKKKNTFVGKRK